MLALIACLTMFIDHLGSILSEDWFLLRVIGRLAMPIYAYFIASGAQHTRNRYKYVMRVCILAIVSQLPYSMLSGDGLNVCVTWVLSLLLIYSTDGRSVTGYVRTATVIAFAYVLNTIIGFDYGFYGLSMPLLFYLRNKSDNDNRDTYLCIGMVVCITLNNIICYFNGVPVIWLLTQYVAIESIFVISLFERRGNIRVKGKAAKICYHWFYPVHMAVLACLKLCT